MAIRVWKIITAVLCSTLILTLTACTAKPSAKETFAYNAFEGTEPVKQNINGLNIIIDPRIELLAAAQYISKYNDMTHQMTDYDFSYSMDVKEYFSGFRTHPAITAINELAKAGFTHDAPPTAMLYIPLTSDKKDITFSDYLISRSSRTKLDMFASRLSQFSLDSDFKRFYNDHADFYKTVIDKTAQILEGADYVNDLEMYYGMEQNSYNLILSPLFGPVGYGPRIQSANGGYDIYSIQGTISIEDDMPAFGNIEIFKGMVYHEFSHSFVNPLTEKYRDELNKYKKLYEPVSDTMKAMAYADWETCVNEHIVRAVTARLILLNDGRTAYDAELASQRSEGFFYIPQLCEKLSFYEDNRDIYSSFSEFYPDLIEVFRELSESGLDEDFYKLSYSGPVNAAFRLRDPFVIIYSTDEKDAGAQKNIRKYSEDMGDMLGKNLGLTVDVISDKKALESDLTDKNIIAYGTLDGNMFLREHKDSFPLLIKPDGIIAGKEYTGEHLRLITGLPNPLNTDNCLIIYTAQKAGDIPGINSVYHGPEDYLIIDGMKSVTSGNYAKEGGCWSIE